MSCEILTNPKNEHHWTLDPLGGVNETVFRQGVVLGPQI